MAAARRPLRRALAVLRPLALLVASVALRPLAPSAVARAQETGAIAGRVTEAGGPVQGARVEALSLPTRRAVAATVTGEDGRFALARLVPGSYALAVSRIGYAARRVDSVTVAGGATTRLDLSLSPVVTQLEQVVTTASRKPEKVVDAPASISVVTEREIRERPSLTPVDHLRATPGVDATQGGIVQTNVVARGFNNAFSGTLLTLIDNRFASVPSLRVNIPFLFTATNEDIDRIEVVLGPGAALYGPNAGNGVMHIVTKSPFESRGSTLTVDGGERSILRVAGRHAAVFGRSVGLKLSGERMQGRDWEYRDPAEPDTFPATPSTPLSRVGRPNARDFDVERWAGEARLDWRPDTRTELVTSYGRSQVGSSIELTGANGAAQVRDWSYQHLQTRLSRGRLFAQLFANASDAGNDSGDDLRGTFLLRTGQPIVDQSRTAAAQVQHGFDLGGRQAFLYGADYIFTNPRTAHTINGRYEDDDNTNELGGYLHSVTKLARRWELVSALRVDVNDRLDGRFYSPRVAVVWKPTATQNWRATYNRAYSTPSNFNFFLDLLQGSLRPATGLPYDIRAVGVPKNGFTFRRDCATGVSGLCMRSPFAFANGGTAANASTAAVGYQNALAVAIDRGLRTSLANGFQQANPGMPRAQAEAIADATIARLKTLDPGAADVGSGLRLFDPARGFATAYSADSVRDIEGLKATFVNNFEVGYKGTVGRRASLSVDGWYQRRENFITPAVNVTPTVFLDAAATRAYLTTQLQPVLGANSAAVAAQVAAGLAQVPAGTVVPESRVTTNGDITYTYRNLDRTISLYGADVAGELLLSSELSLRGTYSWVSDVEFPELGLGGKPVALNAPGHKATMTTRFAEEDGAWSAELRGRYTDAFPVNSGVYVGTVPVNLFVDAGVSWRIPYGARDLTWSVNATNLLDNRRASFVGVPEIGRLVMTRLQYRF